MADAQEEGDLRTATIPVVFELSGDTADQALRKYARDWIRKQGEFSVDARFKKMKNQSWWDDDGKETRICGAIVLTWWPRPKLSDEEKRDLEWRIDLEKRRAANTEA